MISKGTDKAIGYHDLPQDFIVVQHRDCGYDIRHPSDYYIQKTVPTSAIQQLVQRWNYLPTCTVSYGSCI